MKKAIMILFFICLFGIVYSQSPTERARNYHQIALQEHDSGNDSLALIYANKSLAILEVHGDTVNEQYAEYLHDVGMFSIMGSDFDTFSNYMQRAISLKKRLYGTSDDYYWSIQCFGDGMLYYSLKTSFPQNISLLEWAVEIYNQIPSHEELSNYCIILNNLAEAYEHVDLEKSIAYIQQVLSIKRLYFPESDTLVALSNLGEYYKEIGDYQESLAILLKVLHIRENQNNPDNDQLIQSNIRLASLYGRMRDHKKAYYHSEKARELEQLQNGVESELFATISMNSALYLYMSGDTLQGLKLLKEAYSFPQSDKEDIAFNLAGMYRKMGNSDSCYYYMNEYWISAKKHIVDEMNVMTIENRHKYYITEKTYLSLTQPIRYMLMNENHQGFKQLAFECAVFINELTSQLSRITINLNEITNITEYISNKLSDNEYMLVIWSDMSEGVDDGCLLGFVINKNSSTPQIVKWSKEIIYKSLKNEIPANADYLPLYENIWKPLIDNINLKKDDTIFIVCNDIFNLIPIEFICDYNWDYIGDLYNIIRVSNPLNFPPSVDKLTNQSAVLYGGLIYDCKYAEEPQESIDSILYLSDLRANFKYLPWTKYEIDSISKILTQIDGCSVELREREAGTKTSFTNLSESSPAIIHVATHGVYRQPQIEMSWFDYNNYCMEQTGLLLSCSLDPTMNDGILSAKEISALDLSNTDLVVLSACKTGLGGITPYGISGLQQALKSAGVNTILMTLGNINDAATCFFMVSFYKALASGLNKRDAFRYAQKQIRENEFFKDFGYWASFIMLD
jgi:CHAT domain-containing protein